MAETLTPPETTGKARARAGEMKDRARDKATELRDRASAGVDRGMSRMGDGIHRAGEGIRSRAPEEGRMHNAAEAVAGRFDGAARYLQDHDLGAVTDDVGNVVRRYPFQSLLVGAGVGYLIGRLMSRNRDR